MSRLPQRSYSGDTQFSYRIFRTFWVQYNEDAQQTCTCARILAFHLMTERTSRAVLKEWAAESETPCLHPAVIRAAGTVPLDKNEPISEHLFAQQLMWCADTP